MTNAFSWLLEPKPNPKMYLPRTNQSIVSPNILTYKILRLKCPNFVIKKNDKNTIFSFFSVFFLSQFLFVLCKRFFFFLIILNYISKLFVIPIVNWRDILKYQKGSYIQFFQIRNYCLHVRTVPKFTGRQSDYNFRNTLSF